MNFMESVICDTCGDQINLRIGMSNRDVQPFRFSCPRCGSPIDFTIGMTEKESKEYKGATRIIANGPFDDQHHFVDLHLDFPVKFGKYVMGQTPFFAAIEQIGHERFAFHNERLNQLNIVYKKQDEIRNLVRLYSGPDKQLFRLRAEKFLKSKFRSSKKQDVNAALYSITSMVTHPFVIPEQVRNAVEGFPKYLEFLYGKDKVKFEEFSDHLANTRFLRNIQQAALEIFPSILDAELPLRPALFLDFDAAYQGNGLSPARISTDKFNAYKDLYKDISEVINRQIVIVAGMNNLLHRGDYNDFSDMGRKNKPASLDDFANVPFGSKRSWLDNCWYFFDDDAVDNQLRNAIAHFKADYDERTQIITYYPKLEGMEQEHAKTMYFLDFMRKLLHSFREMNYVHHLVKSIIYFRLLIEKKDY